MKLGSRLHAPTPEPETYKNDLIHPCVRYIHGGFAGYRWWMVATPFLMKNAALENPILYYGNSENEQPPLDWTATAIVEGTPLPKGYNSDPCLYVDGNGMWVFWRANWTVECEQNECVRAVIGLFTTDGYHFGNRKIFAKETLPNIDHIMCPVVAKYNGNITMYTCNHEFIPNRIPLGISIWGSNNTINDLGFVKTKEVLPKYYEGFDFWHFDVFEHNNKLYCVVSPESGAEILLGRSDDGEHFTFWNTPLLSAKGTGRFYFYKPSALVLNETLYLWHPLYEFGIGRLTSRLWMSEMNFESVIHKLETVK